jgi:rod shape-determining protein MreD
MERRPGIRPRPSLWRQLDMASRRGFPAASTLLMLLAGAAPLALPGQAELRSAVVMGCVFFWSVFRPASMPPATVFLLGLVTELLGFEALGVQVLTLLVVHGLAFRWRRVMARQAFWLVWVAYAAVAIGATALQWALTSLLAVRLLPGAPAAFQAALSVGLYPALALVLTRAHQTLAEPERA